MEKEMELEEEKKNPSAPKNKPIPYANVLELKRKLNEKLIRAEVEARIAKDEAKQAYDDEIKRMERDEKRFGYDETNLYKFNEEDQDKIMDGLQSDDGYKLAESLLDSMKLLQAVENMHVQKRLNKKLKKMKKRKHANKKMKVKKLKGRKKHGL